MVDAQYVGIRFAFLRRALGLRFWLAAIPALALASEPAQVFFERMVMAETIGLLALVACVLASSRICTTATCGGSGACLCGLGAANFRTSLLPVVIGLGITVPLLRLLLQAPRADWRFRAQHLAAAMAMLLGSHLVYTHAYGYLNKCPPGYLALSGMMQVGLVAPLIRGEDFEGTGVSGDVLKQVQLPLDDHWQRGNHIWSERGLWRAIEKHSSEPEAVARVVTRRAMLRDVTGLLRINVETLGGYFDREKVDRRMQDDKAVIAPDEHALQRIQEWLRWDARGVDAVDTPARRYFAASPAWLTGCLFLLFPLALATVAAGWRRSNRAQYCLLALVSMGLVASHVLFAHIVSFRYLHPLPWFVLANVAALREASCRNASVARRRQAKVRQRLELATRARHCVHHHANHPRQHRQHRERGGDDQGWETRHQSGLQVRPITGETSTAARPANDAPRAPKKWIGRSCRVSVMITLRIFQPSRYVRSLRLRALRPVLVADVDLGDGIRSASAWTVSSVSISNSRRRAGKLFTKRRRERPGSRRACRRWCRRTCRRRAGQQALLPVSWPAR